MPNLLFVSCGEFHWPFLKPVNQIWPVGACAGPGRLTGVAAQPSWTANRTSLETAGDGTPAVP